MMFGSSSLKGGTIDVTGPIVTLKLNCAPVSDTSIVTSGVLTAVVVVAIESVKSGVENGTNI